LGPPINRIFDDFYGIRFDRVPDDAAPTWESLWEKRSMEDWQRLASTYDVHYLAVPGHLDLHAELVLDREGSRLYRIPPPEPAPVTTSRCTKKRLRSAA